MGKQNNNIKILFIISLTIALLLGFLAALLIIRISEKNLPQPTPSDSAQIAYTIDEDLNSPAPTVTAPPSESTSPAVLPTEQPTEAPSASPSEQPSPTPTASEPPASHSVTPNSASVDESDPSGTTGVRLDVPSYNQTELGYPLGCEIISLAMMIHYTTQVDIDTLVSEMPRDDDPNKGFRGDPASTSYGWTILPQPLSALAEKHLGAAEVMTGCETEDLKAKLLADTPVMTWVNGLGWPVHAICLTGYDEQGFYYNDPASGKKDVHIPFNDFEIIWKKPIYDKLLQTSFPTKLALSY